MIIQKTVLHKAIEMGNMKIVKLLLSQPNLDLSLNEIQAYIFYTVDIKKNNRFWNENFWIKLYSYDWIKHHYI